MALGKVNQMACGADGGNCLTADSTEQKVAAILWTQETGGKGRGMG